MRVGVNYAFSHNRHDSQIGPDIWVGAKEWLENNRREAAGDLAAIPLPAAFHHVDRNLANLKRMGVSVVRWFLLGNGANYGVPPRPVMRRARTLHGSPTRYEDREFNPPSTVDKRFPRDFTELLRRFRAAELQIIPSLIDFPFGAYRKSGPTPNGTYHGGRADVIRDPAKRKVFLDTMLRELLDASKGFEKEILAWEVINEPTWLCVGLGPLSEPEHSLRFAEVTIPSMREFLADAVARIDKAGFRSTVGHRFFDDMTTFPAGTMPQFHFYNEYRWYAILGDTNTDPKQVKGAKLFAGQPKPFLGELDTGYNRYGDRWTKDLGANDSLLERLRLLRAEGCDLALVWPDMGGAKPKRVDDKILQAEKDVMVARDVLKFLPDTRADIVTFTGGTLPPPAE